MTRKLLIGAMLVLVFAIDSLGARSSYGLANNGDGPVTQRYCDVCGDAAPGEPLACYTVYMTAGGTSCEIHGWTFVIGRDGNVLWTVLCRTVGSCVPPTGLIY